MTRLWTFSARRGGHIQTSPLTLSWTLPNDAVSQNYPADDLSAFEMFGIWHERLEVSDDLLPLHWMVHEKAEGAPWQLNPRRDDDFLDFNTDPMDVETGDPINWLALEVIDGTWEAGDHSPVTSGFIQVATGWKPSPLQPFVSLQALTKAVEVRQMAHFRSSDD